jgi:hypothetical protein
MKPLPYSTLTVPVAFSPDDQRPRNSRNNTADDAFTGALSPVPEEPVPEVKVPKKRKFDVTNFPRVETTKRARKAPTIFSSAQHADSKSKPKPKSARSLQKAGKSKTHRHTVQATTRVTAEHLDVVAKPAVRSFSSIFRIFTRIHYRRRARKSPTLCPQS